MVVVKVVDFLLLVLLMLLSLLVTETLKFGQIDKLYIVVGVLVLALKLGPN